MNLPPFLRRFLTQPKAAPLSAGAELARIRHAKERNRVIDRANEMAVAQGKALIKRRAE